MTNIAYSEAVVRDDSTSVDENSELDLDESLDEENLLRSGARATLFSALGKGCFSFVRSANSTGSASRLKGESSDAFAPINGQKVKKGRLRPRELADQGPPIFPRHAHVELSAAGWPSWLIAFVGEAIRGWVPRRTDSFEKLEKIKEGACSIVYKAKDLSSGKIVALKKVQYDLETESVKFMAREILILRRLDHPNVLKLEGLVISRLSCTLYFIFEYMEHDLAGLAAQPGIKFTVPQVKCYIRQLLLGLEHCHNHGVLHRDIKMGNLFVNNGGGVLKIVEFGSASFFDPCCKHLMTSRVTTLWYRPPELLLGEVYYGIGVDLWSVGCVLGELLLGKPIMPGRTEVEQLQKIFELCGSPSEEFWNLSKLPYATLFKQQRRHKGCIAEIFNNSPPSLLPLIETLLAIDPAERQSATAALTREFFTTEPYACDLSNLPQYPPSKEMDAKPREANARSFVIGYMTSFFDLPVGSIFRILSLASPQDVCRVSVVSSAFQFAADSDSVWKGFLPSDHEEILSRASCAISFSSMKELYFRLCNSIPIDNSRKVFSLDRSTGKKCYMFCARELGISGLHDVKY